MVALLGVQLGPQAAQVLRILAALVALAGGLLARALLGVETTAVKLAVPLCVTVSVRGLVFECGTGWRGLVVRGGVRGGEHTHVLILRL